MEERAWELLKRNLHVLYLAEGGSPAVWRKHRKDGSVYWRVMRDDHSTTLGFRVLMTDHDSLEAAITEAMR